MADIKNHSTLTTSLVSYWELEEASGTRMDSHGSNDLTDNNTVGQGTGIQGNCADLESANSEYLDISDGSQSGLDLGGDMAFSFWFNAESFPATSHGVISKWLNNTSTSSAYFVALGATYIELQLQNGTSTTSLDKATTFSTATWYHVVINYDISAGTVEFFVNGSSIGTASGGPASINNGNESFKIGVLRTGIWPFDGLIDEVGVWSKVLTSTEVTDLYNSGAGIPYDAGGVAPTLYNALALCNF